MINIEREDIHLIARHSNLSEKAISKVLKENVYNDGEKWKQFLKLFFICLGMGFTIAGIVFFFAYNWASMHKFVKFGLTEAILLIATGVVLMPKIDLRIRKIVLTGASMLVGVLFIVFGQIYQTGADTYQFFLVWTAFITLWVLISDFAPLWLFYVILIDTTIFLYSNHISYYWPDVIIFTILFIMHLAILVPAIFLSVKGKSSAIPGWFQKTMALSSVIYSTFGLIAGIMGSKHWPPVVFLALITAIFYWLGLRHGLKTKSGLYISIIPFSLIVIFSFLLIRISDGGLMLLCLSLFLTASITITVKNLIAIQKKWADEK